MDQYNYFQILDIALIYIKHTLAFIGSLVIIFGAFYSLTQYLRQVMKQGHKSFNFDAIRLNLGRSIVLGLEFIIAADVIETTSTPDYYALGILGLLVLIRTFLNYFLNKDLTSLSKMEKEDREA